MHRSLSPALAAVVALLLSAGLAAAAELRVVTVGALQVAVKALAADFAKQTGTTVNVTVTNPMLLKQTLSQGPCDVVFAAAPAMDAFAADGTVEGGSRVKVGRVGIGVAIRAGSAKPDLGTEDAFKKTIRAARNVIFTDPTVPNASGAVTQRILAAAGLLDAVKAKGRQEGLVTGRELIAKGEYELGLFNVSEAEAPGVVLAGPVPPSLQQYTHYDASVMAQAAGKDDARKFLAYMTAKAAAARWTAAGIEPM